MDFNTVLERFIPIEGGANSAFFIESTLDFLDLSGLVCASKSYHQQAIDIVSWYKCLLLKCNNNATKFERMNEIARVILAAPFLPDRKGFMKSKQTAAFEYIKKHGAALKQAAKSCDVIIDIDIGNLPLFTKVLFENGAITAIEPQQLEQVLSDKCGYATIMMCKIPQTLPPNYLQIIADSGHTNALLALLAKPGYNFDMTTTVVQNAVHLKSWILKAPEDQFMEAATFYIQQEPIRFDKFARLLFDVWQSVQSHEIYCRNVILKAMEAGRASVVSGGFTGTHLLLPLLIQSSGDNDLVFLDAYLNCFRELPFTMIWESKKYWMMDVVNDVAALCMVYGKFANQNIQSAKFVFLQLMDAFDCSKAIEIINMIIAAPQSTIDECKVQHFAQFIKDMRVMMSGIQQ